MKIRLQSSWEIKKSDGMIELFSGTKRKKYGIKSKYPALISFLDALKEGIEYPDNIPFEAERSGLKEEIAHNLIKNLRENGILFEDSNDPSSLLPQETIYDRQIRFFRSFERDLLSGEVFNENLQNSTVLIAGLGGYGSWIALLCARMGIRTIIGVDFDRVDQTNLHRQVTYDRHDIGLLKVEACEKKLKEADPTINFIGKNLKIKSIQDLISLLDGVSLVINPFSYVPSQKALNHPAGLVAQAALLAGIPCLTFGGSWIGPLTLPGKTPCYLCTVKTLENDTDLDPEHRNSNIQKRAFAPPIATCCSMAAFEAARFLSKCDTPQILHGLIQLDVFNFSNSKFLKIKSSSDCPHCDNIFEGAI
jgi:molybdopterin-synthase adenylyltransferase